MDKVAVRELRHNGGAVLDHVARGASLVVTRDGADIAELRPAAAPACRSESSSSVGVHYPRSTLLGCGATSTPWSTRRGDLQQPARHPPFDAAAARAFGRVAASLRRSGRKPSARAFDALIAAVALANYLPVHTANPDHFAGIDGLDVRAVDHPR